MIRGKSRTENIHMRIFDGPGSPLFSDEVVSRGTALFDEAEQAVVRKPVVRHRVRVARLPLMYVQIAKLASEVRKPGNQNRGLSKRLNDLVDQFDIIARKEGVTSVGENRSYEKWHEDVKRVSAVAR
jgi:hypothetical protein